jgi:hypothetical protein
MRRLNPVEVELDSQPRPVRNLTSPPSIFKGSL